MNNNNITEQLIRLMQLDIDAAYAYEQALKNIEHVEIHNSINQFREDHLRHINDLRQEILNLGGTPPENTEDFKGYLIEGFTSLRSITGTEGALKAMQMNEVLTNKTYANVIENESGFPSNIRTLLEKNYNDEKKHLRYIQNALENKIWKEKTALVDSE